MVTENNLWRLQSDKLRASSPHWSTRSVRSLDISSNIPQVAVTMDNEDSPWGGQTEALPIPSEI